MHDEDNAIGLHVQNPRGESWTAYGDMRLRDKVALDSSNMCHAALQTSVDEIYAAWKIHQVPDPAAYAALSFAPTLASAQGSKNLCLCSVQTITGAKMILTDVIRITPLTTPTLLRLQTWNLAVAGSILSRCTSRSLRLEVIFMYIHKSPN